MAKNLWATAKLPKWSNIAGFFEIDMIRFAETVYEKKLDQIVSPFETDIPFQTVIDKSNGKKTIRVEPMPGIYSSNRVRGEIETSILFRFLNDGTSINYAVMPDDFANESFPGSLNTVAQRYNRKRIYLDFSTNRGIEGRRWLEVLKDMNEGKLKVAVHQSMFNAVSKVIGK